MTNTAIKETMDSPNEKTIINHTQPGNELPNGEMSEMRRSNRSSKKSDIRGVRLPDMPASNSSRQSNPVRKEVPKVEYGELSKLPLPDRINLLNAFSKLKNKKLHFAGFNDAIWYIINEEFSKWIDSQISLLLGSQKESPVAKISSDSVFNPLEVEALKTLAAKILETKKIANPATPQKIVATPPLDASRNQPNAEKWRREQEIFLKQLEDMNRNVPESLKGQV